MNRQPAVPATSATQLQELRNYRHQAESFKKELQALKDVTALGIGINPAAVMETRGALVDLLVAAENLFLDKEGKLTGIKEGSPLARAMKRAAGAIRPKKETGQ